jgi:putative ABC transport system substrate-binding protein
MSARFKRRDVLSLLGGAAAMPMLAPFAARAQQPAKIPRIGYVRAEKPPTVDIDAFRKGLREHGYVEGKNIIVEYRWADGHEAKLRSIVAELIGLNVDLIVTSAPAATRAAKEATTTIPIIMVLVADPVGFGFVASLARPRNNITGSAYLLPELSGKRLQILKDVVPQLSRVAVLWNASNPYKPRDLSEVQAVSTALQVTLHTLPVGGPDDFDNAFKAAVEERAQGLLTLEDPFTLVHRKRIVDLAAKHRLPAVYAVRPFVEAGGLMSYGPDRAEQSRRAATYVDKILRGTKPADLPVEQPTKFELVINLKAAHALDITIPATMLGRADEVIE